MIGQLTNHLWQSTLFAAAAGLLTLAFRKNRANVRFWLWLTASLKFLLPFALLMSLGSHLEWAPAAQKIAAQIAPPSVSFAMEQISEPFPALPQAPMRDRLNWAPTAMLSIWLCGFAAIALIRFQGWLRIRAALLVGSANHGCRRLSAGAPSPNGPLPGAVEMRTSPGLLEPGVVGWIRPILLLPEGIMERLTPSQLEAVLAHELCHIRRRDNLWASIHMIVEALFWFHPLVWWIGARLVEERERACDEEVLSLGSQASVYADAILRVCKLYLESPLACVSGVAGSDVRRRIEAIMNNSGILGLNRAKKLVLIGAATAALVCPVIAGLAIGLGHARAAQASQAQRISAAKPKFDVASIKPCQPGDGPGRSGKGDMGANRGVDPNMPEGIGGYFRLSPGRLDITCGSILSMVSVAYIANGSPLLNNPIGPMRDADAILGVPKWALAARYTIHAETDDPVANGPTQRARGERGPRLPATSLLFAMLQSLLEDRFQLKMRRVTEDAPMYALTVAKSGLKLRPMQEGDCLPDGPPEWPAGGKPACNWTGWDVNGPNRRLLLGAFTLDRLAQDLAELILDRNVIDRTGIKGEFVARLEYAPDESTRCFGMAQWCNVDPNSDIPLGPTIFAALEQQFGLKLEPIRGPKERLVIDSVERPSEN